MVNGDDATNSGDSPPIRFLPEIKVVAELDPTIDFIAGTVAGKLKFLRMLHKSNTNGRYRCRGPGGWSSL